jgi:hypothetical protein
LYANNAGSSPDKLTPQQKVDEPISVDDILKTLSERTRREQGTDQQPPPVTPAPAAPGTTDGLLDPGKSGQVEWIFQNGQWIQVQVESQKLGEKPAEQEQGGHIEWIFQNGKWVPVQIGPAKPTEPPIEVQPEEKLPAPSKEAAAVPGWEQEGAKTRLIKIPADKLLAGDPRYNIVIKPGDSVFVPVDIIGEFCIMGNVNRTGYIPITGRPMTLKQAIAAAGGLGPLAWPKRCEVVRRIGKKKEEIVMVDLDKIASGEQPDFFIKPHDLINVGTHATSRWRAILRNAFRATYGFGFVYDRNFADRDFYTHRPIPDWF